MKLSNESWLQIGIAIAAIIASAFVPEIRSFFENLFKNIPVLLIVAGIVAIFYLQTRKLIRKAQKLFEEKQAVRGNDFTVQAKWQQEYDEKLKKQNDRIEHQAALLDKILNTNALHLSITRNVTLPLIYKQYNEEVIKRMYYNTVSIQGLQEHDFEGTMITEYQKFYHQKEVERFSS